MMFGLSWAQLKLIGLLVGFGLSFAAGGAVMHRMDEGRYQKLLTSQARAETKAQVDARAAEHRQTVVVAAAVTKEAVAQERIVNHTITLIRKVPVYVTPAQDADVHCITWGLVRLHDAAALGADPAGLVPPAGQPDDACAPVKASDLASAIVVNYGVARQNAEQLDALIAAVHDRDAAAIIGPSPGRVADHADGGVLPDDGASNRDPRMGPVHLDAPSPQE